MYEIVLREAVCAEELTSFLDGDTLVAIWRDLFLPKGVRRAWEDCHPVLRDAAAAAGVPVSGFHRGIRPGCAASGVHRARLPDAAAGRGSLRANFSKFFEQRAGLTPGAFRTSAR
jgi:hypothetical protein